MAANLSRKTLEQLFECPVCFQAYKSPRLLTCGHQFCEECLVSIASQSPTMDIACPVCRTVTGSNKGEVTHLPRATLHQYIQDAIYLRQTPDYGKHCSKCTVGVPSTYCTSCNSDAAILCEECYVKHQKILRYSNHNTVPFHQVQILIN